MAISVPYHTSKHLENKIQNNSAASGFLLNMKFLKAEMCLYFRCVYKQNTHRCTNTRTTTTTSCEQQKHQRMEVMQLIFILQVVKIGCVIARSVGRLVGQSMCSKKQQQQKE